MRYILLLKEAKLEHEFLKITDKVRPGSLNI